MAEKRTIDQKMAELEVLNEWFYGDEFSLDEAAKKYQEATNLVKEIEEDLKNLKNKIEVIDKDFAKE